MRRSFEDVDVARVAFSVTLSAIVTVMVHNAATGATPGRGAVTAERRDSVGATGVLAFILICT